MVFTIADNQTLRLSVPGSPSACSVTLHPAGDRLFLKFPFHKAMLAEVKTFEKPLWHGFADAPGAIKAYQLTGTTKCWSVLNSPRNLFRLSYLSGVRVYAPFDTPDDKLPKLEFTRPLLDKQRLMVERLVMTFNGVLAAEPGCGKTLAAIEIMERSGFDEWWYVGPKSALYSVRLELDKWDSKVRPILMSYNRLVQVLKNWEPGLPPPRGVIFDESHNVAHLESQRTQSCQKLADAIRQEWGWPQDHGTTDRNVTESAVILMTGTPAPKNPLNWWSQCEIACPGFLRESWTAFQYRIADMEPDAGGWNKLIGFKPDELAVLPKRLRGLVTIVLKRDCLDLPAKVYVQRVAAPKKATLRAAKLIQSTARSAASALILLRELSDGFQYSTRQEGLTECLQCTRSPELTEMERSLRPRFHILDYTPDGLSFLRPCLACNGTGDVPKIVRQISEVACPKDDLLMDELDAHAEQYRRLVVYAAFEGSIERIIKVCHAQGWHVIRYDGTTGSAPRILPAPDTPLIGASSVTLQATEPIGWFQDLTNENRVCFVGNAGSAGQGLTLTASPSIVFYSNDFNGASRMQAEERIMRIGCRGSQIIDFVHLDTDRLILQNLLKKVDMQAITMSDLERSLEIREGFTDDFFEGA